VRWSAGILPASQNVIYSTFIGIGAPRHSIVFFKKTKGGLYA